MDFNSITELPNWAILHLPLYEYAEFILKAPKDGGEESTPQDNMYDADDEGFDEDQLHRRICEIKQEERTHHVNSIQSWNFPPASTQLHPRIEQIKEEERKLREEEEERIHTHLHSRIQQIKEEERQQKEEEESERIRQEIYSQAVDSEQPNSLSECTDYPARSHLPLREYFPRIDGSQHYQDNTRAELPSRIRRTTFAFSSEKEFEKIAEENTPMLSRAPRPKKRIERLSLKFDRSAPFIDVSAIFPQNAEDKVSSPVDIQEENNFAGFETMNFAELIFDYEIAPLLYPTRLAEVYRCDVEEPKFFSLVPHWFHDTEFKRCWCIPCIQYRETLSTGKQLEAHDFDKWCLCRSCMDFWHKNFNEDDNCNCQDCVEKQKLEEKEADKKRALAALKALVGVDGENFLAELEEVIARPQSPFQSPGQESTDSEQQLGEKVALAELRALADLDGEYLFAELEEARSKLQSPLQSQSPEQEAPDSEQLLPKSTQKLPSDPLCENPTTVVPVSKESSFDLFNTIRQHLWLDSDYYSGSATSFDF